MKERQRDRKLKAHSLANGASAAIGATGTDDTNELDEVNHIK